MVINDRHRFIFVHIPKTAGTSMMAALEALPGNNRRWLARTKHETLAEFQANWRKRQGWLGRLRGRSPDGYQGFAFVRNPWARMSSYYRYLKEILPNEKVNAIQSFADFLEQAADGMEWIWERHAMRPQTDFYTLDDGTGSQVMRLEYLGHFEHLAEDVADVSQRLGIRIDLGHMNESTNTKRDYRTEYTDRMFEIVGRLYTADAELFGYSPEVRLPARRCSGPIDWPYGSKLGDASSLSISRRTNSASRSVA
jgi:Sulfotransferase family